MAWQDRVGNAVALFRGIEIHLEQTSVEPGRRVQVHEYPLRDHPYAEDLGRKKREWQIEGYIIGDDYDLQRDKLIAAFELPGAGELVHPFYGTHRVIVVDPRIRESTTEGGIARVSFTAVRADDKPSAPSISKDTQAIVSVRSLAAREVAVADFEQDYKNILQLATDRVAEVEKTMQAGMLVVKKVIGDITDPLADLIRSPAELSGQILEFISQIRDQVNEPLRALGIYEDLFSTGSLVTTPNNSPAAAQKQAQAQNAVVNLIRRGAAIESADAAGTWVFAARQDAQNALETIHYGLTLQLALDPAPAARVAQSLAALRAAIVTDLRTRGAALPDLTAYTPPVTLPALVIAQRLYGDASRAGEIIQRNKIRHPGAVPGGDVLEVLNG